METDNAAGWALQNNTVTRRYVRLPGSIDEAFLMIDYTVGNLDGGEDGEEIYAHFNRQGSVIATSDINGSVQDKYTYSPFGVSGSTNTGFPFRFTGQRLDEETGLYYYKARYYDPETGRFLQVDPIGYEDQQNLYAYVGNDPVNAFDPTGEFGKKKKRQKSDDEDEGEENENDCDVVKSCTAGAATGARIAPPHPYARAAGAVMGCVAGAAAAEATCTAQSKNKGGGKNGQKRNDQRRQAAQDRYDKAKKERDDLVAKPNKIKEDNKKCNCSPRCVGLTRGG